MAVIPLAFGIFLTIFHYLSEKVSKALRHERYKMLSLSAGILIAYVFLELMPASFEAAKHLHRLLFFLILIGFSLFHLAEKYIYQHQSGRLREYELTKTHLYAFFAYHFILGIVLYRITTKNFIDGFLFFIPIAFHTLSSTASMTEIHPTFKERAFDKSILANSTLFGVLFAMLFPLSDFVYYSLFGLVVGVLLYVIIRDLLPQNSKGDPAYFALGVMAYGLVVLYIGGAFV